MMIPPMRLSKRDRGVASRTRKRETEKDMWIFMRLWHKKECKTKGFRALIIATRQSASFFKVFFGFVKESRE